MVKTRQRCARSKHLPSMAERQTTRDGRNFFRSGTGNQAKRGEGKGKPVENLRQKQEQVEKQIERRRLEKRAGTKRKWDHAEAERQEIKRNRIDREEEERKQFLNRTDGEEQQQAEKAADGKGAEEVEL